MPANSASTSGSSRDERAAVAQHADHARRMGLHQAARELLPHAFRRELRELSGLRQRAHQRERLRRDGEREARGEARDAQHAQRILGECRRHVAEDSRPQVRFAAEGIDQRPLLVARHRVDREIAAREVLVEGHIGRDEELEAAVAAAVLALGARQRVLLVRLRMQEHRKIAADRSDSRRRSAFRASRRRPPSRGRRQGARGARRGPSRRRGRSSPNAKRADRRAMRAR